jgi:hypothetical protein
MDRSSAMLVYRSASQAELEEREGQQSIRRYLPYSQATTSGKSQTEIIKIAVGATAPTICCSEVASPMYAVIA